MVRWRGGDTGVVVQHSAKARQVVGWHTHCKVRGLTSDCIAAGILFVCRCEAVGLVCGSGSCTQSTKHLPSQSTKSLPVTSGNQPFSLKLSVANCHWQIVGGHLSARDAFQLTAHCSICMCHRP